MRPRWTAAVLLAAVAFFCACSREEPKPALSGNALTMLQEDVSGRALEILNRRCATCHTSERSASRDFNPEEWNAVLGRMLGKGAALSGDERDVLRRWRKPSQP
jgi:cytochrome c2